jgi:hypothetical protein
MRPDYPHYQGTSSRPWKYDDTDSSLSEQSCQRYSDLQNRYNVLYFFSVHIMVPVCMEITLYVGEGYWRANPLLHIDTWVT